MADHAVPQYTTAPGNDYEAHEHTYESFVHIAFVGTMQVISIVIGLAIGGVTGHWLVAFGVFVIATIAAIQGFMSKTQTASYVALALALAALAFTAA